MTDARAWIATHATTAGGRSVLHDALLAVLDLHREDYELGPTGTCCECVDEDWPCPTVKAISEALGDTDD